MSCCNLKRVKPPVSVIQRYYASFRELLDVYGAQEFGQQQDNRLLFFNTMGKDYRLAAGDVKGHVARTD